MSARELTSSFELVCVKQLHVRDRVMTSHDVRTRGTSLVLTIASLQMLKTEALISAPADCEMRSVIKSLNTQSISSIETDRQLCQHHFQ